MDGRCVRLSQGEFDTSVAYSDDPVEVAVSFAGRGVERLHVVDLDGARSGSPAHYDTLRAIKAETDLVVDFGGGIRSSEAVESALEAGADLLSVGSVAASNPDLLAEWAAAFGARRFIFAADVRAGNVSVSGWTRDTQVSVESALERVMDAGIETALVTEISVDGTLAGPALALYRRLRARFPGLYLIASGGVGSETDVAALEETGVDAVIIGKAIYEGRVDLSKLL